ncbi:MAG: hypothetical protein ACT4PT_00485 [Methanobacteriota archaeon]
MLALTQRAPRFAGLSPDWPAEFSDEAYYGPAMQLSEALEGEPGTIPDEIGPDLLSGLLRTVGAGEDLPEPVFAGCASPVRIVADSIEEETLERVWSHVRTGLSAKETFEGLPVMLFRGQTGGLMFECSGDASTELVARTAISWSVAVNRGNLCLWGGRLENGRWLLGLTP